MANIVARTAARERWVLLAALLGLASFYLVGLDQGHLLSLVQGGVAFDQNLLHEILHDARHAAGFPCH